VYRLHPRTLPRGNLAEEDGIDVYVAVSTAPRVGIKGLIDALAVARRKGGIKAIDECVALLIGMRKPV
jgi:hypothetical protein